MEIIINKEKYNVNKKTAQLIYELLNDSIIKNMQYEQDAEELGHTQMSEVYRNKWTQQLDEKETLFKQLNKKWSW